MKDLKDLIPLWNPTDSCLFSEALSEACTSCLDTVFEWRDVPTEDLYDALIKRHHFVLLALQIQFKEAKTLYHVLLNYSLHVDAQF